MNNRAWVGCQITEMTETIQLIRYKHDGVLAGLFLARYFSNHLPKKVSLNPELTSFRNKPS